MASVSTTGPKISIIRVTTKAPLTFHSLLRCRICRNPCLHISSKSAIKTSISCSQSPVSAPASSPTRPRLEYFPNRMDDLGYVRIFDTALHDGDQSPGATMTSKEKLDTAQQLAKIGVDIIKARFPAASKDDFEAVKMIANEVGNAVDKDDDVNVAMAAVAVRVAEESQLMGWEE